jgi:hypothetical protein
MLSLCFHYAFIMLLLAPFFSAVCESGDVFEAMVPAKGKVPIWDINASAISAGRSHGVTADHQIGAIQ